MKYVFRLPMTGFELQTSRFRSNHVATWATSLPSLFANNFFVFHFYFNKWAIHGLFFIYFRLFKPTLQFLQQICIKKSIQYMLLGFEPTTFRTLDQGSRPCIPFHSIIFHRFLSFLYCVLNFLQKYITHARTKTTVEFFVINTLLLIFPEKRTEQMIVIKALAVPRIEA